jgi:hypothetical protein
LPASGPVFTVTLAVLPACGNAATPASASTMPAAMAAFAAFEYFFI